MEVHCLRITRNTYVLFLDKSRSYLILSYAVNIAAKAKEISRAILS